MKPPTTAEAIRHLLAEVEVLADSMGSYEQRNCEILARVNALGTKIEGAIAEMRELIEMVRRAQ